MLRNRRISTQEILTAAQQCRVKNCGAPISARDVYYALTPQKTKYMSEVPSLAHISRVLLSNGYSTIDGNRQLMRYRKEDGQ